MAILKTYGRQVQTSADSGAGRAIDTGASQVLGAVGQAVQTVAGVVGQNQRIKAELDQKKNDLDELIGDGRAKNLTDTWTKNRSGNIQKWTNEGKTLDEINELLTPDDAQYDEDMRQTLDGMPLGKKRALWEENHAYGKNVTRPAATRAVFDKRTVEKKASDAELVIYTAVENGNIKLAKEKVKEANGILKPETIDTLNKSIVREEARQTRQAEFKKASFAIKTNVEAFKKSYDPTKFTDDQNVMVSQMISETETKARTQTDDLQSSTFTGLLKKVTDGESISEDLMNASSNEVTVAGGVKAKQLDGSQLQQVMFSQKLVTQAEESSDAYLDMMKVIKKAKDTGVTHWNQVDELMTGLTDGKGNATFSEQTTMKILGEMGDIWTDGKKFNPDRGVRFKVTSEYSKAWDAVVDSYSEFASYMPRNITASAVQSSLSALKDSWEDNRKGFDADTWISKHLSVLQKDTAEQRAASIYATPTTQSFPSRSAFGFKMGKTAVSDEDIFAELGIK